MLVTANRKTTKVKSHLLRELQRSEDFEAYQIPGTKAYKEILNEAGTVENIIATQLEIDEGEFDTNLFSAFYNLLPEHFINESDSFELAIGDLKINDHELIYGLARNRTTGVSFYEWFSPVYQKKLLKFIKENGLDDSMAKRLNLCVMYCFFEFLRRISRYIRKYDDIKKRYPMELSDYKQLAQGALQ